VSAPTAQPPTGEEASPPAPQADPDSCPLCGTTLDPNQDWCLRCGAAARTRLATEPNWKGPVAVLAVIAALALAVLAVALVKLAGKSNSSATTSTLTVPAAVAPATSALPATTAPAVTSATVTTATAAAPTTGSGSTAGTGATGKGATGTTGGASKLTPAQEERLREAIEGLRNSTSKRSPSG
jgi:hypothetical protein